MHQSFLICSLAGFFYCYEYLLRIAPNVMLNEMMAAFHISAAVMGHLAAYYYYAYAPTQLPVGFLIDRFGPKRMLTLASICCTVGSFLFANSLDFGIAAFGRLLVGFGSAFAFIGVLKLSSIWFPSSKFALATGLVISLGTIGVMFGNILISWMVVKIGWQITLQALSTIGIIITPLLWFFIKDDPSRSDSKSDSKQDKNITKPTMRKLWQDTLTLSRSSQLWINAIIGCLLYLPTSVFNELWGYSCLLSLHGMRTSNASFAISMTFLGWAIGAPIMGYLSEKLGRRKIFLQTASILCLILFCIILYLPTLSYHSIDFILFLLGFCSSPQILVLVIAKENYKAEMTATTLAFNNFIIMMGGVIFQPLVGSLLDFKLGDEVLYPMIHQATNTACTYSGENYMFALTLLPIALLIAFTLTFFLKSK